MYLNLLNKGRLRITTVFIMQYDLPRTSRIFSQIAICRKGRAICESRYGYSTSAHQLRNSQSAHLARCGVGSGMRSV
jgi:hypothetical protein